MNEMTRLIVWFAVLIGSLLCAPIAGSLCGQHWTPLVPIAVGITVGVFVHLKYGFMEVIWVVGTSSIALGALVIVSLPFTTTVGFTILSFVVSLAVAALIAQVVKFVLSYLSN